MTSLAMALAGLSLQVEGVDADPAVLNQWVRSRAVDGCARLSCSSACGAWQHGDIVLACLFLLSA